MKKTEISRLRFELKEARETIEKLRAEIEELNKVHDCFLATWKIRNERIDKLYEIFRKIGYYPHTNVWDKPWKKFLFPDL